MNYLGHVTKLQNYAFNIFYKNIFLSKKHIVNFPILTLCIRQEKNCLCMLKICRDSAEIYLQTFKNIDYFEHYLKFKKILKFELFLQYLLTKWKN